MNERITLLAKQASTFAFTEYPKQTMATFNTNKSLDQLFNKKFAELIVRECAEVSNQAEKQCQHPGTMIKQHFGVEK